MAYTNIKCGIYKISLNGCNEVYIGLTKNFAARKNAHIRALKSNIHFNIYLQRAFNKYGIEGLAIELIDECEEKDLINREIYHILQHNSFKSGFNLTTGGDRFLMSDDIKSRISDKHKGKIVKESTKQKLREINLGKKLTIETIKKITIANANRILTKEDREKMSNGASYKRTEETKIKMSKSRLGKNISEETKIKIKIYNLKRVRPNSIIYEKEGKIYIDGFEYVKGKRTPLEQEVFLKDKEIRMKEGWRKSSITKKGHIVSQETKDKISKANKGKKATEEQRIANSERQKGIKKSEEFKQKLRDYYKRKRETKWDASQK